MAKPDTVYRVPVNGEVRLISAQNRAQAIRAATLPMVGEVKSLTAIELLAEIQQGGAVFKASELLAGNEDDDGGEE